VSRLFIWRHGQTEWNVINRIQGHADVALDAVGRAQAIAAAAHLANERPDVIITSDLRRTADTAAALAGITGLAPHRDPRLRERYFGTWQGMTVDDVEAAYPEAYRRWRTGEQVGACEVEDLDDLSKRVGVAAQDAAELADGGTAVIVTHGGSAKYILGEMLGWPREVTARIVGLSNCHWFELRHSELRGWVLHSYNVGRTVD
jgi:glucosyl-3-phosphoglycerate phosphatase